MIKINLLAEKKPVKTKSSAGLSLEGASAGQNLLFVAILIVGMVLAGGWWWSLENRTTELKREISRADQELARLEEIRKKSERFKAKKDLLARKIQLITDLKKQQEVPVRILDQVSRNLPEFLWLESMSAQDNEINISGKATTYTAVSNFYANLTNSGYFREVNLGRTFEVPEGVSFSLSCIYAMGGPGGTGEKTQS